MPTLPLLSDPLHPNASHRILSPGGYEGWHFHAISDDGRLHVSASLHEAWAGDVRQLRRYWLYRRFPTRFSPPDPRDYPAVTFALFEAGHRPARFVVRAQRDEVRTREDGRAVRIAGSHFERSDDGAIQLHLRGVSDQRTVAANLTFRPVVTSEQEIALTPAGEHRLVPACPMCDVEGEVSTFDQTGASPRVIGFAGSGSHDHTFGTRSPAEAGDVWWSGHALLQESAIMVTRIDAGDATLIVARKDAPIETMRLPVNRRRSDIQVGSVHLSRAEALDSGSFEQVTSFDAIVAGERGRALCSRVRIGRMSNPLWNVLLS